MGLDIWLGWPGKSASKETEEPIDDSEESADFLRFTYSRSGFLSISQSFDLWAQTQLGGKGVYWILDLDDRKRVPVEDGRKGSVWTGTHPDWEQCKERVTEALALANAITDHFYVVRTCQYSKPLEDYPTTSEVLDYYRGEREKKKNRPKLLCKPPYYVVEDFQTKAGVFFGDVLPNIKGTVLCRGALGFEVLFVCQGDETIHTRYMETLAYIQKFVVLGAEHQAWLCWSG